MHVNCDIQYDRDSKCNHDSVFNNGLHMAGLLLRETWKQFARQHGYWLIYEYLSWSDKWVHTDEGAHAHDRYLFIAPDCASTVPLLHWRGSFHWRWYQNPTVKDELYLTHSRGFADTTPKSGSWLTLGSGINIPHTSPGLVQGFGRIFLNSLRRTDQETTAEPKHWKLLLVEDRPDQPAPPGENSIVGWHLEVAVALNVS